MARRLENASLEENKNGGWPDLAARAIASAGVSGDNPEF